VEVAFYRDGAPNVTQVMLTEISPHQLKIVEEKLTKP
jgi:hypothetical protein